MKILHIGWWMTPFRYGGAINATLTLMQRQIEQGHQVYYFCAGRYNLFKKKTYIKEWTQDKITVFELVNSPNLIGHYGAPQIHCYQKDIEQHYTTLLKTIQPDIVHIQELEGLCGSVIQCTKKLNIPVVMFFRNYWMLCPQRELMDMNGAICTDFNNGRKCINCTVISQTPKMGWMILGYTRKTIFWPVVDKLLEVARILYKALPKKEKPNHSIHASDFQNRRNFMINVLKMVDLPVPISSKTQAIFNQHGLDNNKMKIIPSISRIVDIIKPKKRRTQDFPVSFGFNGGVNYHKGVHILIQAFKRLPQGKCRLLIFGKSTEPDYLNALKKDAQGFNVSFKGPYSPDKINSVMRQIDVGVIPSIWEEAYGLVGPEFLSARIPIIGNKIGGIPDYLEDNINGFLTIPGNVDDLTEKMMRFIHNPELIAAYQQNIKKTLTTREYCTNIINEYKKLLPNKK